MNKTEQMNQRLIQIASELIGTTEQGGENRGAMVEKFQTVIGEAHGEPWCASFVQFCVNQVCTEFKVSNPLFPTEHVLTLYNHHPKERRYMNPAPGRLIVWQYYKKDKPTINGHMGIVTDITPSGELMTIEGNTSPDIHIAREGDGVYLKRRQRRSTLNFRLRGFLEVWPAIAL